MNEALKEFIEAAQEYRQNFNDPRCSDPKCLVCQRNDRIRARFDLAMTNIQGLASRYK